MTTLDLKIFGAIGFQDFYLEKQGYKGKNLLKLIADRCFDVNLDFCAITSISEHVKKGGIHDKFGYLIRLAGRMPKEYEIDILERVDGREREPALMVIRKADKKTVIINSQSVLCKVGNKRVDNLVLGSNQIPSYTIKPWEGDINKLKELKWVVKYAKEKGLVQVGLYPFIHVSHAFARDINNSAGKLIYPYLDYFSAIEGQSSEFCIENEDQDEELKRGFGKQQDKIAQEFAEKHKKPWIAVSGAHRIEDIGLSHIITKKELRIRSANAFLEDLDNILKDSNFENKIGYQTKEGLKSWYNIFQEAVKERTKENYKGNL